MSLSEARTGETSRESIKGSPPEVFTHSTSFLLSMLGMFSRDELGRALEPMSIKPRGYEVLVMLAEEGPASQQTVCERIGIDKSTMVPVVDELEKVGLVQRRRNPQNRRAYELTLTNAGREALSQAESAVAEVEEAVLAPLNEEGRMQLHKLLLNLLPDLGGPGQG